MNALQRVIELWSVVMAVTRKHWQLIIQSNSVAIECVVMAVTVLQHPANSIHPTADLQLQQFKTATIQNWQEALDNRNKKRQEFDF